MTVMKQFLNNKSNLWNRGLTATLLRDGIPHGCWFASYEYCKTIMSSSSSSEIYDYEASSNKNDSDSSSSSSSSSFYKTVTVPVVSGAFAATAAWVSLHYIYCTVVGLVVLKTREHACMSYLSCLLHDVVVSTRTVLVSVRRGPAFSKV
jgi:hypothetical protein